MGMPHYYARLGRPMRAILGIFLVLFGGLLAWMSGTEVWLASRAGSWPTVEGGIFDAVRQSGGARADPTARVSYAYRVAGRDYLASRVDFGVWGGPDRAAALVERYRPGGRVTVHYDPANPARAVLELATPWWSLGQALLGLAIAGWGLVGVWCARRPAAPGRPAPVPHS